MVTENYEILLEDARQIPIFYYPEQEKEIDEGITFDFRDDCRTDPRVRYSVNGFRGAGMELVLGEMMPLVERVLLTGEPEDMPKIKGVVQKVLGIDL